MRQSIFVSILADGSTDVLTKEQEVVYLRYVSDGEIKTQFVFIKNLSPADTGRVMEVPDRAQHKLGWLFLSSTDIILIP